MVPEAIFRSTGSGTGVNILLLCPSLDTTHIFLISGLPRDVQIDRTCALELAARATACWTRAVLGLVSRCTSAISAAIFALPLGPVGYSGPPATAGP